MQPLRLGVIGVGSVVREIYQHLYFASEYSDRIAVAAACDTNAEQLAWFGDLAKLPQNRLYGDYRQMLDQVELDAVAVNTPDSAHREPAVAAMERGLDVLVPKPLAATISDAHAIIDAARRTGRKLVVDFHKREDPLTKEARARIGAGVYGTLQSAVWYMVDQLQVADPNHEPRFFASPDFAANNTPVSFLTVHMADTFFYITGSRPVRVRATGFRHKLPNLTPISVAGFDLVDTEVLTDSGCLCHIITGWAIPNTAASLTVQSARIIGSEGYLDLGLDSLGYREVTHEALSSRNTSFRTFEADGTVSGFGIRNPGRLLMSLASNRDGTQKQDEGDGPFAPAAAGFWATVVCEAAHESLSAGNAVAEGVVDGSAVNVAELLQQRLGSVAARYSTE